MVTNRMQKFDELILREISTELRKNFPGNIFSVTQVHVTKDLSFAKVWVSSVDDVDSLIADFQRLAPEIRTHLAKKITARRVPKLYFVSDLTEEKAQKIEKALLDLRKGE